MTTYIALLRAVNLAPARAAAGALQDAITGREIARLDGRCAYIVYPDGIGA